MTDIIETNQNQIDLGNTRQLPKVNVQTLILALIAIIAVVQAFQLIRINARASSQAVKSPAPITSSVKTQGTSNNAAVPQSMVGGC